MIPPEFLYLYLAGISFLFGACIGSFLNVCIYRIPLEQSVIRPPSHCYACKKPIAWHDNIPLLSYLALGGRCRNCKASYSPRYFFVELLTAVLFLLVWMQFGGSTAGVGFDPRIPVYWLVVSGLVMGTFVDFDHLILPDRVTIGGMITGLGLSALVPSLHDASTPLQGVIRSGAGLAAGFGTLWLVARVGRMVFKQDAMGFGDVKLLGAVGAYFGAKAVFFTILLSSLLGSVVGVGLVLARNREWQSRIPYGPYLALGAVLWMLWGETWWDGYLALLTPQPASLP